MTERMKLWAIARRGLEEYPICLNEDKLAAIKAMDGTFNELVELEVVKRYSEDEIWLCSCHCRHRFCKE